MKRALILATAVLVTLGVAGPAQAQTPLGPTEIVSIDPASGPLGTMITVTVRNCPGGNADGTARLDFGFNGFTPANTVTFYGDASGADQTVQIEALGGEGKQQPGQTDAYVMVSQCKALDAEGNFITQQATDLPDGSDVAAFTVTYDTEPPASTTTTTAAGATTTTAPRTGTLPKTGGTGGLPMVGALLVATGALLVALRRSALGR